MNKQDFILQKKTNGDARSVADIGVEFDALMAEMQPKQKTTGIVYEHIALSLGIAEQERVDGKRRTGMFDINGNVVWGDWSE